MYITVTIRAYGKEYDIQADNHLPIGQAAGALDESVGVFRGAMPTGYRSMRRGYVDGRFSFAQAGIHSGDILTAVE